MVGTARFELATYGTQNRRATRLRYAPTEALFSLVPQRWKAPKSEKSLTAQVIFICARKRWMTKAIAELKTKAFA